MYGTELLDDLRVYSVKDLVEMGYGSRTTVWRMMKSDPEFPAVKLPNGSVKIPRYALREYLKKHEMNGILDTYDEMEMEEKIAC